MLGARRDEKGQRSNVDPGEFFFFEKMLVNGGQQKKGNRLEHVSQFQSDP